MLDLFKLGLLAFLCFFAFSSLSKRRSSIFGFPLSHKKRTLVVFLFTIIAIAIETGEEVIEGDTAKVDREILLFLRAEIPEEMTPFFHSATFFGSFKFIAVATIFICSAFLIKRKKFEGMLFALTTLLAGFVIYVLKSAVKRDRPALWETEWYWGTSFPSGHTLASAAFASALVVSLQRIYPQREQLLLVGAFFWVGLIALSRLVLGVHWPSDVLAAACIGTALPHLVEYGLVVANHRRISIQKKRLS